MGINDVLTDFGRGLMQTNTWQGGIAQGLNNFDERKKKAGLAQALQGMSGPIPDSLKPYMQSLVDAGMTDQAFQFGGQALMKKMEMDAKPQGAFQGTGMDAQVANILIAAEQNPALKATPQYKIAVQQYTQPTVTPDGMGGYRIVTPTLPNFSQGQAAQPQPMPPTQGIGAPPPARPQGPIAPPNTTQFQGVNLTTIPSPTPKPLPSFAQKKEDTLIEEMSTADGINNRLKGFEDDIAKGTLSLGALNNFTNEIRNTASGIVPGVSGTTQSVAYGDFKAELERLRNDSLRLNAGVQTDGDAKRAWNELVTNINDPKFVLSRLSRIRALNQRAVELKGNMIALNRSRNKAEPLDMSQIIPGRATTTADPLANVATPNADKGTPAPPGIPIGKRITQGGKTYENVNGMMMEVPNGL